MTNQIVTKETVQKGIESLDQFVSLKGLTHKQLANVVTHITGTGMKADYTSGENLREWARYYAVVRTGTTSPVVYRKALKVGDEKKDRKKGLTE
jgi:hypothetical protein